MEVIQISVRQFISEKMIVVCHHNFTSEESPQFTNNFDRYILSIN